MNQWKNCNSTHRDCSFVTSLDIHARARERQRWPSYSFLVHIYNLATTTIIHERAIESDCEYLLCRYRNTTTISDGNNVITYVNKESILKTHRQINTSVEFEREPDVTSQAEKNRKTQTMIDDWHKIDKNESAFCCDKREYICVLKAAFNKERYKMSFNKREITDDKVYELKKRAHQWFAKTTHRFNATNNIVLIIAYTN